MSTIKDFENAPVGSTATNEYGLRAMKLNYEGRWAVRSGAMWISDDMERFGYRLDPAPAPTTAREALDLAWELAHPVREGQELPEGTQYLHRIRGITVNRALSKPYTASAWDEQDVRTLEPLPDIDPLPETEPDWLDAPAVLARAECFSYRRTWVPAGDGYWVSVEDGLTNWDALIDVAPLYPKGQEA